MTQSAMATDREPGLDRSGGRPPPPTTRPTGRSRPSSMPTAASSPPPTPALTQSQSVMDTASSAISSVITTINSIQTALTEATNPGADIGNIQTTLTSLGQQLTDAVNGASFNGLNVLDGSQTDGVEFRRRLQRLDDRRHVQHDRVHRQLADRQRRRHQRAGATARLGHPGRRHRDRDRQPAPGSADHSARPSPAPPPPPTALARRRRRCLNEVTNYAATIGADPGPHDRRLDVQYGADHQLRQRRQRPRRREHEHGLHPLQALQTQEQLGIQSLSIANQNAQLILKLFP